MTYETFETVQVAIQLHGFEVEAAMQQAKDQGFASVEEFATELVRLEILNNLENEEGLFLNAHVARKNAELRKLNAENNRNGTGDRH